MRTWLKLVLLLVVGLSLAAAAEAQGTRSPLTGTVTDAAGGVLPGVTVVVASEQTGAKQMTVTNEKGAFTVPALDAGTYSVTLTLPAFKTTVAKAVAVVAGAPANVSLTMELGGMEETVQVSAVGEMVQTQSTTVSTLMNADSLKALPFVTRNLMDSIPLLVGIDSASAAGDNRDARVNGLPGQSVALTMDGVSIKSAQGESDFYAYIFPTIDSVEQVTVTGATQGADSSGGSASVRFVTRSGTQKYSGSFFEYFRHPSLNSNYYFNEINGLPKARLIVSQSGGTVGGPIQVPGMRGRKRAFFFVSWEEFVQPVSETDTRTILSPEAAAGTFRYQAGGTTRQVNLLALAAQNKQTSAVDPTTTGLLATIRNSTNSTGVIRDTTNPNVQNFIYQPNEMNYQHLPTVRLDANISSAHKLTVSYRRTHLDRAIGTANLTNFPGLPGGSRYDSLRTVGSVALRSTVSPKIVNELTFGWQNQLTARGKGTARSAYDISGGYNLGLPLGATGVGGNNGLSARRAPLHMVEDRVSWLKGSHAFSLGGSWQRIADDIWSSSWVPTLAFGVETGSDPADAMFNTTNFPGASATNLNDARALYGYLTGRITGINGNVALEGDGQYHYLGRTLDRHHLDEFAGFAQDQWRMSSTATLNYGVRYLVQLPGHPDTENYTMASFSDLCGRSGVGPGTLGRGCNLFQPGVLTGDVPTYELFTRSSSQWKADTNNLAPNLGIAWRPNVNKGFWSKLLGSPEEATLRAGFSMAFNSEGTDRYRNIYSANPGRSQNANRNSANGNLVLANEAWPLLFSQTQRLGPPAVCSGTVTAACYPATLTTPLVATTANSLNVFAPDYRAWYSKQYSAGFQRAITKDMAVEIRYVGTRSYDQPVTENWNEVTLVENGFLDEFKKAQANLYANMAAGRGQTFAYTGAPGTSPLPIFLASFNGLTSASNPASYSGSNWTSSANTALLNRLNPRPGAFLTGSSSLFGNATFRANGLKAGLPANFWVLNPDVSAANILVNANDTVYNSMQIELRRRFAQGLQVTTSYSRSFQRTTELDTIHKDRVMTYDLNHSPHAFKFFAAYEIPVGRDRAIGQNLGKVLSAVIGDWNVSATSTVQSGLGLRLADVKLVGMSEKDLQKAFRIRFGQDAAGKTVVYTLPQDIIDNTIRAFSSDVTGYTQGEPTGRYLAPATGPDCIVVYRGDCGPRYVNVRGPISSRLDLSFKKQLPFGKSGKRIELQYDLLNAFDAINFTPVFQASSSDTINQVTAAATDPAQVFDPGGRLGQIVMRVVW